MKTSNRKLHFFNPGHEVAVWLNKAHYTPPASVSTMMTDLSLLPIWYGEENDAVIVHETNSSSRFLFSIPEEIRPPVRLITPEEIDGHAAFDAFPWGLSPHSIHFFEKLQKMNSQLHIPTWKNEYRDLVNRKTASECLSKLKDICPSLYPVAIPHFCSTLFEVQSYLSENAPPFILKTPYSCSGRGVYWLYEKKLDQQATVWVERWLKKQSTISIEPALSKVCDFAMEFESSGNGEIEYKGLSVFQTQSSGAFSGNLLGSQDFLRKHLSQFVPNSKIDEIQKNVSLVLAEKISSFYEGYLGVDMLVYQKDNHFLVHPFIELNVRNTMGLVAIHLSRLIHPESSGIFKVGYHKLPEHAIEFDEHMRKANPLFLKDKKISSGYLSLCPIKEQTHYLAYIQIKQF